jgi:hypothetical protein
VGLEPTYRFALALPFDHLIVISTIIFLTGILALFGRVLSRNVAAVLIAGVVFYSLSL